MNLTVSLFESHAKKYEEIVRHADDLFVVLEDEWLDIWLRQHARKSGGQKPSCYEDIDWSEGKQAIRSFEFDVFHERPVMVIKVCHVGDVDFPLLVEIDQEVIDMYNELRETD